MLCSFPGPLVLWNPTGLFSHDFKQPVSHRQQPECKPYLLRIPLFSGYLNLLNRFSKKMQVAVFWESIDQRNVCLCARKCADGGQRSILGVFVKQSRSYFWRQSLTEALRLLTQLDWLASTPQGSFCFLCTALGLQVIAAVPSL